MNNFISTLLSILRPLYLPYTKKIRRMLVSEHAFIRHRDLALPTPWDFVQFQVERKLSDYLHCDPCKISQIVIVGANTGEEINQLKISYPNAYFTCFEPSPKYFPILKAKYQNDSHVDCRSKACGEGVGEATFFELPMDGNGSLLQPDAETWLHFNQQSNCTIEQFKVEVSTLDIEMNTVKGIDLLWIDVQGAEGMVLRGGSKTLPRIKSVFLEIAISRSPYESGSLFQELDKILMRSGHQLAGLGVDPWNYTGNALWIQTPELITAKNA